MTAEDTKEQIMRAAELQFARDGYANTSLREITDMAGANIAAVNYHFGSKEKLLIEILDRIVGPINEERIELLDAAEAESIPDVTEVLTAFLLPDLHVLQQLRSRDPSLPRFVSRMYSEGSELMYKVMGRQFAEAQARFYSAFQRAVPGLSGDEIAWRLSCVVGIVLYLFASVQAPGMPPMMGDDVDKDLRRLLDVTIPLMSTSSRKVVTSSD